MAEPLTTRQAQILDKAKAAVEVLLGVPARKGYWTTPHEPLGADATALAAFRAHTLDEIWVYPEGRVHFSLDGVARKVDDKTRLDLPPPDGLIA